MNIKFHHVVFFVIILLLTAAIALNRDGRLLGMTLGGRNSGETQTEWTAADGSRLISTEELAKAFYAVSEKLYGQQGGQAGQPGPDMGGQAQQGGTSAGPDVVDADYEVVDDDNNKK